ncbi:MAG: LysM domain-containing protein [Aliidongia sp.]
MPGTRQHVVQPGETLYAVARDYGVEASSLARENHLNPPYTIKNGAVLMLPAPVETAGAGPVAATASLAPPPAAVPLPPPATGASGITVAPLPPPEKPASSVPPAAPPPPVAATRPPTPLQTIGQHDPDGGLAAAHTLAGTRCRTPAGGAAPQPADAGGPTADAVARAPATGKSPAACGRSGDEPGGCPGRAAAG